MNSKQRKQKEKRIAEALASEGVTSAVKKMEREREIFDRFKERSLAELAASRKKIEDDRAELNQMVEVHMKGMAEERAHFQNRTEQLQNVRILRDVLIDLECGLDPLDIAAKLRKDFDVLIPQW